MGQTLDGGRRKAIYTRKKLQLIQCNRSSRKVLMVGEKLAEVSDERWLVKHSPILRQFLLPLPLWAAAQVCGPLKRALL